MAKFTVTMKDPDYATQDEAGDQVYGNKAADTIKAKYMEWDEYLTVELDTETGTARVLTVEESKS